MRIDEVVKFKAEYAKFLVKECDASNVRFLDNHKVAYIMPFAYTVAIIVADIGDYVGYSDRWCYHTSEDAMTALEVWDGEGEPKGWHRHPASGRRRQEDDPATEYVNL